VSARTSDNERGGGSSFGPELEPKPAPSAEPDPELEFWLDPLCTKMAVIRLSALRMLMAPIGLAIVPAAAVPSAEERVWRHDCELNARRAETFEALLREAVDDLQGLPSWRERAKAELARRAAKEGKTNG
jgi:hypothetical protein